MPNSSPLARGAFLLATGLLAIGLLVTAAGPGAGTAQAATLDVTGPAGAEVLIDGQSYGALPLDAPLELPVKQLMILQVRRGGYSTHEQQIYLNEPTTEMVVEIELLPLGRRTAMVSSAILAGSGQFYQGRMTAGWIQMGLQVAAWSSVVYGELTFQNRRDDYEDLNQKYQDALAPSEITRLRDERDTAWNELDDAKTWRNASLGAVALIAAYSVFDAWRGHNRFYTAFEPASASLDGNPTALAGLRWNFGGGAR